MFNDSVVEAGEAFIGQAISGSGGIGNVQIWNPNNSGILLYIDQVIVSGESDDGADIRYCRATAGTIQTDHSRNKRIDGTNPKAEFYTYVGNPPQDYPYNRPVQEVWMGGFLNDKTYKFDPAIVVPQGRGVIVSMADNSRCFASFQWREKVDPLGQVGGGGGSGVVSGGTINTDMTNSNNAFDGNETTYADNTGTSCYIGKIWSASQVISRFVVKSPSSRTFSGASPARVITYVLETWNGTAWTATSTTGTFTESSNSATQSVIDVAVASTALGHRIRLGESAVAAHRVSEVTFYS